MAKKLTTLMIVACFAWALVAPAALMAQDEGEPAMRTVAMFSGGGGAAGAGLGVMWWIIDPMGPSSDFMHSTLTGFAVGALAGIVLGVLQLQRQAVFPYDAPGMNQPSEFDGGIPTGMNMPRSPAMPTIQTEQSPRYPLAAYQYKF